MTQDSKGAILITGGAGYIGSHAALALLERQERVVILDDYSAGPAPVILDGARYVEGNVGDAALVKKLVKDEGIDSILHFAGFIRVDESMREPQMYFMNNTENTKILMNVAVEGGVKNVIFSSSAAVYGNPEKVPILEDVSLKSINPYGESKLRSEKIIRELPLKSMILRYFNVAGADPKGRTGYRIEENPTHLIRTALRKLIAGDVFHINGRDYPTPDGTCIRDYIHVSDLAEAHIEALEYLRNGGKSQTMNCGYGHGYSVVEVVNAVMRATNRKLTVEYGPRREGDPAALVADVSRIKKTLAWKPQYDNLETIIRHEYEWVRAHTQ
ncbi:UDP-glucose 4-epimerase GalE [Candidatus Kaiserbacteria bacterium]|nr:UDP-glucose 4-epimerase GalE [Candidatus Kaiserbacteria bacterium]